MCTKSAYTWIDRLGMAQIGGEPLLALAARVNVGGAHMTDLLQRLLLLQQPLAYASLGARMMAAAEALKVAHPPCAKHTPVAYSAWERFLKAA
jgi:hypothetical protein